MNISDKAVEAASIAMAAHDDRGQYPIREYAQEARAILEAAMPHMTRRTEWGVFRASDGPEGAPVENYRYKSREAAQRVIDSGYRQPQLWEVRGRKVGEWSP